MKAERIILSLIAIFVGLLVAGAAFYLYQMTKQVAPDNNSITIKSHPTPTSNSGDFLVIESPKDESIADRRTITISGKTLPNATLIISSEESDQVVKPTTTGTFSVTQTIDSGVNIISTTAVFADGTEQTLKRSVTYTTDDF